MKFGNTVKNGKKIMNAIIPKFLLDLEDIIYLKDSGIKLEEGTQIIGKYKVPCYKFYNISETEVFDELDRDRLYEAKSDSEKLSYATRMFSILFLRLRQVNAMTDKNQKLLAACSLTAAVNSLASINLTYAKRFLPMLRSLS